MSKVIALVVGTRPEAIKMAPIWFAMRASRKLTPLLISTGQQREMLHQTLSVFGLKPDVDLDLMQSEQTLSDLTARVIVGMTEIFRQKQPAAVLVQGDTTTVLGTALAAFYEKIPLGHVEAGLRTYDYAAPWPEEMNRRLVDPISRWCFAPTEWSAANLRAERIPSSTVHVTGNTVVDALLWVRDKISRTTQSVGSRCERLGVPEGFAKTFLGNGAARMVLVTGHRRESFGSGFEDICRSIMELSERYPQVGFLYPLHLNPKVREPVRRMLGGNPRIALIAPLDYQDFIWFLNRSHFVLSDSGGVQEEAPSLGKPVLVMRGTTERPEGVEAGTCRLVGTSPAVILREAALLLDSEAEYLRRSMIRNPYGDGSAAPRIVDILEQDLG